ncbi:NHL repeat protein [Lysobacter enzymogenes]|uniref:NHL repeat protein n=1 Tax=Lysobacter enzymogenes TaxID=69 RepID=A0A0S2DME2_LYSEN|nr:NHL repeat-containing protein [Lysobacter enzymogenes]ALN59758.1 NHL repeat protein [Lysobacter enzymogenes]QCW27853.1 gluconolaconase [Lysobacter enzymogenes]
MSRKPWILLAVGVTALALAATFVFEPKPGGLLAPQPAPPPPTPFDWSSQVEWIAGDGVRGLRNGAKAQARFDDPYGLVRTGNGTLYIADAGDNNRIRMVGADGRVATVAGSKEGFVDGSGLSAAFDTPSGLALDGDGNLYVADTGNHAIRKISRQGVVSTLAGDGTPGYRDGPGAQARFDGPMGVAVSRRGRVFVADTYNDRIRVIEPDGTVSTLAGNGRPGFADGAAAIAQFDTPTALALDARGLLWVADTRNKALRRVEPDGDVATLALAPGESNRSPLVRPAALAITHDGWFYVADQALGGVLQIRPDGNWALISGDSQDQRLSRPAGLALADDGSLYLNDANGHRVHRIAPAAPAVAPPANGPVGPADADPLPDTAGRWPLKPQDGWHEVVGTLGEVRGDGYGESRHHLHGGLDIRGDIGQQVLAIADAKVSAPVASWGFGNLGEGAELGRLSYIHMRVGRTAQGEPLDTDRFQPVYGDDGKLERMRLRRGTRFAVGDVLGTINPMAHVHLSLGPSGFERNAIALNFVGYADHVPPRLERIELLDALGQPLKDKREGRLIVPRALSGLQLVAEGWDQVDDNLPRRRLGLYAVGYQWLDAQGKPLPGYETPRMNIEFDRLPPDDATQTIYAPGSGITVHGSAVTRFRYVLSNTVRGGRVSEGLWLPSEFAAGDYTLRVVARDYSGNEAVGRRDLAIRLQ